MGWKIFFHRGEKKVQNFQNFENLENLYIFIKTSNSSISLRSINIPSKSMQESRFPPISKLNGGRYASHRITRPPPTPADPTRCLGWSGRLPEGRWYPVSPRKAESHTFWRSQVLLPARPTVVTPSRCYQSLASGHRQPASRQSNGSPEAPRSI